MYLQRKFNKFEQSLLPQQRMKKTIVLVTATIIALASMSFDIMDNNGIAGRTGSPSETTCNACHTGNPLNDPAGSITFSSPMLTGMQYMCGQTYTINITVARPGVNLFGFACEALTSTGANAGSLVITDALTTTTKNATVAGNSRKSVVHKLNGGASANTHTFTFDWTAPATNVGNITFYFAGNATNSSNTTSGDFIYKSSQVVIAPPVGVNENAASNFELSVFPNPTKESATITYTLDEASMVDAELISITGQEVSKFFSEEEAPGQHEQKLAFGSVPNGIYMVALNVNGKQSFKKLIVN